MLSSSKLCQLLTPQATDVIVTFKNRLQLKCERCLRTQRQCCSQNPLSFICALLLVISQGHLPHGEARRLPLRRAHPPLLPGEQQGRQGAPCRLQLVEQGREKPTAVRPNDPAKRNLFQCVCICPLKSTSHTWSWATCSKTAEWNCQGTACQ